MMLCYLICAAGPLSCVLAVCIGLYLTRDWGEV